MEESMYMLLVKKHYSLLRCTAKSDIRASRQELRPWISGDQSSRSSIWIKMAS